ncbi:carboxypeptidase regulatory-like domain-containing protein [Cellulomonas sp. JH27-2]|uniref:carboxypeptidase regulatory-like domain-containing protein n=1 Tax=Cellulomonas sp. JH27-2 TaxID=2774139 RepID=UPI001785BE72|nr:carboxypeptidase regulatory-like domain-containing protein [Cellulomonas sp. JH27-2]MBD8057597.1 carboxypeptidase regulatory-like domain-containing protein [Cellulomonas sp. JH27-2]
MRSRPVVLTMLVAGLVAVPLGASSASAVGSTESISGHVTFAGQPVAGAIVEVNEWNNEDDVWEPVFHGTTDASGAYSIEVQAGYYEVSAETASPSPYLRTDAGGTVRDPIATVFAVKASSQLTADISMRAGALATGKVVDSAGKPATGMTVLVASTNRFGQAYATTDAAGAYTIEGLATGPATLELAGTRGVAARRTISLTAGTTTKVPTIHLANAATITGHIKAKSPRNQDLTLLDAHHDVVWNANSDSHGNVKITGLPAGAYRLVLDGTNLSKRVVVKTGKTASFGTITRANRTYLSGTVTTPSGKAAAHAYVQLTDTWGTYAGSATTDAQGQFKAFGVLSGAYRVHASNRAKGYADTSVRTTVTKGKDKTGVRIKLTPGGTLTGVVKNSAGAVVPGVVVVDPGAALAGEVVTDSHGRWTLRGVTPGKRTVDVYDPYPGGYRDVTRTTTAVAGKITTVSSTLR